MATTTRRKKTTVTTGETMPATHTTITISDICKAENVTETAFRLALQEIRPDDFDTVKAIPTTQADQAIATLASAAQEIPALPETTAKAENLTPFALQPATETAPEVGDQPQNSLQVANTPSTPSVPTQGQNKPLPTALTELIAASQETIELADLVSVYRNEQILSNAQTRDNELVVKLREQRIENRNQVFSELRELNSRQPLSPELPELPASLTDEIKALSDELGKSLSIG